MTILTHTLHTIPVSTRVAAHLRDWLLRFKEARDERRSQRIDRQAFQHLRYLDDSILADIGYTRVDVVRASNLPIEVNAALELRGRRLVSLRS